MLNTDLYSMPAFHLDSRSNKVADLVADGLVGDVVYVVQNDKGSYVAICSCGSVTDSDAEIVGKRVGYGHMARKRGVCVAVATPDVVYGDVPTKKVNTHVMK